jgi:pyruvate carboxylase subunit A
VRLAQNANYVSAGTVEFLVGPDDAFYFLEVNTRIQVEHTVTEVVTGIDIIREQLLIAEGEPISFSQEQVAERGFAIQVRINAEDPRNNFLANPGVVQVYQSSAGPGVRLDGAIYQGYEIPPYYDSLMVKLTVYGFTWPEAVQRLARSLRGFLILGVKPPSPISRKSSPTRISSPCASTPAISTTIPSFCNIGNGSGKWTKSPG